MQAITSTGTCVPVNRYVRPTSRPATCPTTTMAGDATTKTARPGVTTTRDTERNTSGLAHHEHEPEHEMAVGLPGGARGAQQHAGGDREDDGQQTRHHRQQLDRPLACAARTNRAPAGCGYHHPLRCAQSSTIADMTAMIVSRTTSRVTCVRSLTMTFMPRTEDNAVIGSVTAAMTARRSAAIVIFVFVRVW